MPSNTEDREHTQKVIHALLLTRKEGYTVSELRHEYQEVEGTAIPWQSFGFMSLLDFIRSMPSIVQVKRTNGTIMLKGIATDKTKHISTLVAEQKEELKKKGRKTFKPSHFFPKTAPLRIHIPAGILTKLVKLLKEYPDGISKDYVLQYVQSHMPSINITMRDLEEQLQSMSHKLTVLNNRICLVENQTAVVANSRQSPKCHYTNTGIPESQSDNSQAVDHSANGEERTVPLPNLESDFQFAPTESCSDANFDGTSVKTYDNTIISDRMKFRLEKLIQNEPSGIWCAELPEKYLEAYKISLNYMEYGFSSVRDFASQLTDIFRFVQPQDGGDFKLYYAKAKEPPNADASQPKSWENSNIRDIFNTLDLPEALPPIISTDIIKEIIPDDVMTIGECVGHILVETLAQGDQLYVEVNVVEIFTPSFFWIQLRKAEGLFDMFMNDLHNFYSMNHKQYRIPSIVLESGLNCACKYDGKWHRGVIKTVKPDLQVTVMFYDYGTLKTCPAEEIHYLHRSFSHLPAQAIPCGLVNTKPKSGEQWSRSVTHEFALRTSGIPLVATIASYNKTDNSMMVTLTDTLQEDDVHINDWMVEQNLAVHGKMDNCVDMHNLMMYVEENLLSLLEPCYDENDTVNDNNASEEQFPLPLVSCLATLADNTSRSPPGLSRPERPLNVEHILDEFDLKRRNKEHSVVADQATLNPFLQDATACNQPANQLTPRNFVELWKQNLQMQMQIIEIFNSLFANMMSESSDPESTFKKIAASGAPHAAFQALNSALGVNQFSNPENFNSLNSSAISSLRNDFTLPDCTDNPTTLPFNVAPVSAESSGISSSSDPFINSAIPTTVCEEAQAPLGLLMTANMRNSGHTPASSTPLTSAFTNGTASPTFASEHTVVHKNIDEERGIEESYHNETNPFKLSLAGKLRIPEPHEDPSDCNSFPSFFKYTELNDTFGHSPSNVKTMPFNDTNIKNNDGYTDSNCENARRSQSTSNGLPSLSEQYDTPPITSFQDYRYTTSASTWSANNISDYLANINIDPSSYQSEDKKNSDEFSKDNNANLITNYVISGEDDDFCNISQINYNERPSSSAWRSDFLDTMEAETDFVSEVDFSQENSHRSNEKYFQRAPTRQNRSQNQDGPRLEHRLTLGREFYEENQYRNNFPAYSWSPITGFTSPLLAESLQRSEDPSVVHRQSSENSPGSTRNECGKESLIDDNREESEIRGDAWIKSVESSIVPKSQVNDLGGSNSGETGNERVLEFERKLKDRVSGMRQGSEEKLNRFDPGVRGIESSPLSHKLLFQPVELNDNEVAYIFHYRNEGWILTDQFVKIFTDFKTSFYMINLLAMYDIAIPFEELEKNDFLAEFIQLESVLRKYSLNDKEISTIHLMPLNSMLRVLDKLGLVQNNDNVHFNLDCARGTIMHGAVTLINAYAQFKQRIDALDHIGP